MLQKNQMILGYIFAIGATAIWSGNFIIARGLSESISPISLAFYRWVVAVIIFLPLALKSLIAEWEIIKENIPYLAFTSLLGITIFNTLIYFASHTTTAINLSLISITFPVFIVILSRIFYHEAITVNKCIGILLVAIGIILLITKGSLSKLFDLSFAIGDIWMLIAALIFAIYSILLKRKPKHLSIWAFQLSTFLLGLIFLCPFFIWEYATSPPIEFDFQIISSILYVGIFASLTAFVLWNKAIMVIGPSRAGMIYYTLPLFSGVSAYIFLNENIGTLHFYSALLIIMGIFIANYDTKKV
ncbi:MAG: DMT family transporter [Desulfobacterium sp.]